MIPGIHPGGPDSLWTNCYAQVPLSVARAAQASA